MSELRIAKTLLQKLRSDRPAGWWDTFHPSTLREEGSAAVLDTAHPAYSKAASEFGPLLAWHRKPGGDNGAGKVKGAAKPALKTSRDPRSLLWMALHHRPIESPDPGEGIGMADRIRSPRPLRRLPETLEGPDFPKSARFRVLGYIVAWSFLLRAMDVDDPQRRQQNPQETPAKLGRGRANSQLVVADGPCCKGRNSLVPAHAERAPVIVRRCGSGGR